MAEVLLEPLEFRGQRARELHASLVVAHAAAHRQSQPLDLFDDGLEFVQRFFTEYDVHLDAKARALPEPRQLLPQRLQRLVREIGGMNAIDRHGHGIQAGAIQLIDQLIG